MQTWDAIISRRNVREYQERAIEEEDLTRILEAARRTPSSKNLQRWDLIAVTDRDRLQQLSEVWRGARHIPGSAATIALVGPDPEDPRVRESVAYDMGQLTMSIMLSAADLGIGSGHSSVHDQDVARRVLDLPDDRRCWWLVGLGYPADRPLAPIENPDRRPLDDMVHHETW